MIHEAGRQTHRHRFSVPFAGDRKQGRGPEGDARPAPSLVPTDRQGAPMSRTKTTVLGVAVISAFLIVGTSHAETPTPPAPAPATTTPTPTTASAPTSWPAQGDDTPSTTGTGRSHVRACIGHHLIRVCT